jgi:hypothetical protein
MEDTVVPGYKRKSAEGQIFMNPMHKSSYEVDAGYGASHDEIKSSSISGTPPRQYNPASRRTPSGATYGRILCGGNPTILEPNGSIVLPAPIIDSGVINSLILEASTAARSDRGRGNSSSNPFETFAEADQALGMFGQAAKNANEFFRKNGSIVSRSKAAGSAYLLWRYGLSPTMSAVQDAIESVDRSIGRVRQSVRGKASTSKTVTSSLSRGLFGIYGQDYEVVTTETLTVRATILDEVEATLVTNNGITFKNLATLPWELIPYSFVVDWFLNIGDFIGSLIPVLGQKEIGSCTTIVRETERKEASTSLTTTSSYWDTIVTPFPSHGYTAKWIDKTRTPGIAGPGLTIKSDFRLDSLYRALDAITLINQRLR